jgi:hypothetical protein
VRLLLKVDWAAYVTAVTSCAGTVSHFLKQPAQASLAALSILNVSLTAAFVFLHACYAVHVLLHCCARQVDACSCTKLRSVSTANRGAQSLL